MSVPPERECTVRLRCEGRPEQVIASADTAFLLLGQKGARLAVVAGQEGRSVLDERRRVGAFPGCNDKVQG